MAKNDRPIGRKVTLVLGNQDPKDTAELLRIIAAELRPNEMEIRVTPSSSEVDAPTFADEQLETKAKERTARVLKRANAAPQATSDPKVAREKLRLRVKRLVNQGWGFTTKVVPLAAKVATIVKNIHNIFWS